MIANGYRISFGVMKMSKLTMVMAVNHFEYILETTELYTLSELDDI